MYKKRRQKGVAITERYYTSIRGSYLRKLPLVLTLQVNQLFNMIPICRKNFSWWLQIYDK